MASLFRGCPFPSPDVLCGCLWLLLSLVTVGGPGIHAAEVTQVLIVVGPSTHPPGTHEVAAGARLIAYCLEHAENLDGIAVHVSNGWPDDDALLEAASTIVFIGDIFPPARLENRDEIMQTLSHMMDQGCGMVCIHYATGLRNEDVGVDGDHPLLRWTGGYFATRCQHHQSVARVFEATISPAEVEHPVLRGWQEFTLIDEPYYNNYFGPDGIAPNVTPIATSLLPPEEPQTEIVAWSVERRGGGRGMGIVMPHFYRSWQVEDLRMCILNGVVWSAGLEVPEDGVRSVLPDPKVFAPEAVEP